MKHLMANWVWGAFNRPRILGCLFEDGFPGVFWRRGQKEVFRWSMRFCHTEGFGGMANAFLVKGVSGKEHGL